MAAPQASSRLELLQARFQQKQLQEKEQKLLQLYDQQQQRAYQVVQRGSAGSNGSNHGSSISQHTVTKTSTSSHTTSTSQGGKVRQMFDERRQTTVKGIDRSYPLEPLENKPRKQTNGNVVQKNGNLTVNRQSVTVKRVTRADVNSHLNGGKPVVSYHEEINRESFGPSGHQHADDDEFGNENHVAQYTNENHRDETQIEEVLDEDTIERNRMMAKLHLMQYDETLKHRVKNDLDSEEFPVDYMVEVPDKLPKRPVTRKLSQAEARLERFKNANAKRNNYIAKTANTSTAAKKRSDPMYPIKSTSRGNEVVKTRRQEVLDRGSDVRSRSPRSSKQKVASTPEVTLSLSGSKKNTRGGSPQFFDKASEKSATTLDAKSGKELCAKNRIRRSASPKFFCKESEKSATTYAIDSKAKLGADFTKGKTSRSESPKYYDKEFEKSDTYTVDSRGSGSSTPISSKNRIKRSESPKYFCRESEISATTYAINSKTQSPDLIKNTNHVKVKKESKDSRNSFGERNKLAEKLDQSSTGIDTVDRYIQSPEFSKVNGISSPESLEYQVTDSKRVGKKNDLKSTNILKRITKERSPSPQYTYRKSEANTDNKGTKFISKTSEKVRSKRSDSSKTSLRKQETYPIRAASRSPELEKKVSRKSTVSPQFYTSDSDRSATIMFVTPETITKARKRSPKPEEKDQYLGTVKKRSSQEDVDQSSRHQIRSSVSRFFSEKCEKAHEDVDINAKKDARSLPNIKSPTISRGSSPVSLKDMETHKTTRRSPEAANSRSSSPRSQKLVDNRSKSPAFFCYETEKSATTVSLKPRSPTESMNKRTKSPKSLQKNVKNESPIKLRDIRNVQLKSRSSTSSDDLTQTKITNGKGSGNVLRSTKLIRDIITRQDNKSSGKAVKELRKVSSENEEGRSNVGGVDSRHQSMEDEAEEVRTTRKVDKRAATPIRTYELLTPESSPKSSTSVEVDVEIQEITMPDQYIKQEKLRSTYSKSSGKTVQNSDKSQTKKLFTYSMQNSGRNRGSVLESNIFEPMKTSRKEQKQSREGVSLKHVTQSTSSSGNNSPSPTNERILKGLKRKTEKINTKKDIFASRKQSPSPNQLKRGKIISDESRKQHKAPQTSKQGSSLRSMELVRNLMKEPKFKQKQTSQGMYHEIAKDETMKTLEEKIEMKKSSSTKSITNEITESKLKKSTSKDYERTDSVESALRRFDSIGTASIQSTSELSKELMTEEGQMPEESSRSEDSQYESRKISLRALDGSNLNLPPSSESKQLKTCSKNTSMTIASTTVQASRKSRTCGTQEIRRQKKFAKAKNSIEMIQNSIKPKSPSCKRKLFQDPDSTEDTETESSRSKCSLDSMKAEQSVSSRRVESNKNETADSIRMSSKCTKSAAGGKTSTKKVDKGKADKMSTGALDSDRSLVVKQLRSIEDIRKSIEGESSSSKSAIASNASRQSSTAQPRNLEKRVESRKEISLPKQMENLSVKNVGSNRSNVSVKFATRFPRVAKSPSPDSTKTTEMSSRARRYTPSSPSKSPDTIGRRPSTELKVQETKSTKRPVPMKNSEPIGNRKTTTTTRKSTDVVDGAILENGLHLRDQTAETKYDNDSSATKRSDAFVIDFDEQPPKENDAPPSRKSLLRKQSTEKHTTSSQSARPPSSVSSISSNSSMQGQVAASKNKMATKAKTLIPGTASSRISNKSGGNTCTNDNLVPCNMCGRRFAQDRVSLHEQICAKTTQKKRKPFDAMKYRLRGTDLEPFAKKASCKKQSEKAKKSEVKTNWRRKHEDFINAIRSAKQVQAHLAAGGKLSELPPPPPSDTSDYIQCPHCGRKFNQSAAERHIPKCENMLHNKPVHSRTPKPRR